MYTREQLKEKIKEKGNSLTQKALNAYLKNWRIDPIYEDDKKVEYFDDLAILKLSQGLELKEQGVDDDEIMVRINEDLINDINAPAIRKTAMQYGEIKKLTVDITTQTLALLAESIAQKISDDITNKVKESDILSQTMDTGKLHRDNEILSQQVKKLLDENKKLISRNNFLQNEITKFKHIVASLYMKQE